MTDREAMRRRIFALQFSAWELHLFLDSHPNNAAAAAKLAEYRAKAEELTAQYEEKFGPLHMTSRDTSRWAWICDPWPWDGEGCD